VLANELAYLGKTICFVKTTSLGFKLKGNLGKGEESDTDQIIDDLKKCDVLFLDDMAAEYTKSGWFYIEPLFIVLDYRMQHNKLTFFSSNLKLSDYQDRLSGTDKTLSLNLKRLVERIKALTNNISFELKGKNKRY
jgi:primosomal protein DnaI